METVLGGGVRLEVRGSEAVLNGYGRLGRHERPRRKDANGSSPSRPPPRADRARAPDRLGGESDLLPHTWGVSHGGIVTVFGVGAYSITEYNGRWCGHYLVVIFHDGIIQCGNSKQKPNTRSGSESGLRSIAES